MEWYTYWLYLVFGLVIIGSLATIITVGKPREPNSGGVAAFIVGFNLITAIALYLTLSQ